MAFTNAEAAIAPIYDIEDIINDPQVQARQTLTKVDDAALGKILMQNVIYKLSETPGEIRFTGRSLGEDSREILSELVELSDSDIKDLHNRRIIHDARA